MPDSTHARYRARLTGLPLPAGPFGPSRIFLARHGQSESNAERRITGQLDSPLTTEGRRQAQLLARALRRERLSAIYSSDLARARDTAGPTALEQGLTVRVSAALREMNLGILQGRFRDERDPEALRLWSERARERRTFRAPGGETFADLRRRVVPCVREILRTETGAILIVGHRCTNRAILGALMGWPADVALGFKPRSGHLYEIALGEPPRIRTILLDEQGVGLTDDGFLD